MAAKGIAMSTAAPPLWKLMWSLGINLPPPLYMGFIPLFLFAGSFFGIVFGAGVWVVRYMDSRPMSLHEVGGVAIITGEETIDSIRDKLGNYLLQASEALTNDLAKYRQRYLDRIERIALHRQGLTA
jgi:hypothetical protein